MTLKEYLSMVNFVGKDFLDCELYDPHLNQVILSLSILRAGEDEKGVKIVPSHEVMGG